MKRRKNISISEGILAWARELMDEREFEDFSEFLSALIREEWERRHKKGCASYPEPAEPHRMNERAKKKP